MWFIHEVWYPCCDKSVRSIMQFWLVRLSESRVLKFQSQICRPNQFSLSCWEQRLCKTDRKNLISLFYPPTIPLTITFNLSLNMGGDLSTPVVSLFKTGPVPLRNSPLVKISLIIPKKLNFLHFSTVNSTPFRSTPAVRWSIASSPILWCINC